MKRAVALKYISKSKLVTKFSYISAYKSWNSIIIIIIIIYTYYGKC